MAGHRMKSERIKASKGWRIESIAPYCGSSECHVIEFVHDDGCCVTLYGSISSIREQMDKRLQRSHDGKEVQA